MDRNDILQGAIEVFTGGVLRQLSGQLVDRNDCGCALGALLIASGVPKQTIIDAYPGDTQALYDLCDCDKDEDVVLTPLQEAVQSCATVLINNGQRRESSLEMVYVFSDRQILEDDDPAPVVDLFTQALLV